jgi:hypothetical protein
MGQDLQRYKMAEYPEKSAAVAGMADMAEEVVGVAAAIAGVEDHWKVPNTHHADYALVGTEGPQDAIRTACLGSRTSNRRSAVVQRKLQPADRGYVRDEAAAIVDEVPRGMIVQQTVDAAT